MADQSPADQTPPSSGMQSLSVDSQPLSSSSTPQMSLEEKFKIIRSVGEECIQEDELLNLLNHKPEPICYDGFEPFGRMHIAQGIKVLATCDGYSSQKQAAQDNEAVVEFMADLIAKRDTKAAPPKKEKGFWFRICSICWPF
ncbi:hypothetical protein GOBAR_DD10304 [Gossypium barbadense]|nr:hypothetical protein GOBAR_DD10304 [Gossypium barbadense]